MPKVNCYKCGKELIKKPSQIKACNHNYCNDCKKYCNTINMIEEYESKFNINMEEWLREKYIDEKLSVRKIMKLLETGGNKGISKMLEYYNIPIRYGSEAIKTQWDGNEERKEFQRNNCSHLQSKKTRDKIKEIQHSKAYHEKSSKSKLGDKNPAYKPDLDRDNCTSRNMAGGTVWRKAILELFDNTCDCCGSKENIHTHHLYNWKDYPDKRFDLTNGVCLCKKCHMSFHGKYGRENNTPEQYYEFKRKK